MRENGVAERGAIMYISGMIVESQLNDGQRTALADVRAFLSGTERIHILRGAAGTGKTALLNVIMDVLGDDYDITCCAPTNEATRVISRLTRRVFEHTIYSLLGLVLVQDDNHQGRLEQRNKCTVGDYDLVIVDEASMISTEVLGCVNTVLADTENVKILYIGDPGQLPPVNDSGMDTYESPVFFLPVETSSLTQVMRTAEQNPILGIVTKIREDYSSPADLFERKDAVGSDGVGVRFVSDRSAWLEMVMDDFKSDAYKGNPDHCRVVAFTNRSVDAMNAYVRRRLYGKDVDDFVEGEDLSVTSPYSPMETSSKRTIIYNTGERLKVLSAERGCMDGHGSIHVWNLEVDNYEESDAKLRTRRMVRALCGESVMEYNREVSRLVNEAKRKLTQKREDGTPRYTKRTAWKEYIKFTNALVQVKHTYAMTVHRSQGSTVENVYVIERDIDAWARPEIMRNKLKYVAFSRASQKLISLC